MKDQIKMIEEARKKGIPTFTFKATDKHSKQVILKYLILIGKDENVSFDFENEVDKVFCEFSEWQRLNYKEVKSPD